MFLKNEMKRLPPGLPRRRWGCWELSFSTAFRACCGGGAVTVAAFRYNMCARLLEANASCFTMHSFLTLDFIADDDVNITIGIHILAEWF